jgi:hypothetical protein
MAANVSVDVAASPGVTTLSTANQSYGSLLVGTNATLGPFRMQLPQNAAKGSIATITFTVHWGIGQSKGFPYTTIVIQ